MHVSERQACLDLLTKTVDELGQEELRPADCAGREPKPGIAEAQVALAAAESSLSLVSESPAQQAAAVDGRERPLVDGRERPELTAVADPLVESDRIRVQASPDIDYNSLYESDALRWIQKTKSEALLELQSGALVEGVQRTDEWYRLRDARLTASSFSKALGFWRQGRRELWEEKLGLRPRFSGNSATEWGVEQEATALNDYQRLTGHQVATDCMFKVLRGGPAHSWIGASPDGLVSPSPNHGLSSPGVLEIKCPFNKGNPHSAVPYPVVPFYYMPQVQGLLEVFDREWCDVYAWTVNGSALYRVNRDREYWALMLDMLCDFWWCHVVPARQASVLGDTELMQSLSPSDTHPMTERIVAWSRELSRECKPTVSLKDARGKPVTRVRAARFSGSAEGAQAAPRPEAAPSATHLCKRGGGAADARATRLSMAILRVKLAPERSRPHLRAAPRPTPRTG
eukprot:CAMPEP_0177584406 /NCGR_PEP_ID=MMETSP0419_2-20121207/3875_1 /TAXON_ID=582737 /ORGANISM="Tetraselmis sp., Strain GSL018" /LENGTH=456 /DNA_ID=CAMNT_0019073935 /DNA_START=119 /DNA_END=1491 /DNA_ORIENTATION=-